MKIIKINNCRYRISDNVNFCEDSEKGKICPYQELIVDQNCNDGYQRHCNLFFNKKLKFNEIGTFKCKECKKYNSIWNDIPNWFIVGSSIIGVILLIICLYLYL